MHINKHAGQMVQANVISRTVENSLNFHAVSVANVMCFV
jgi:hypothetical protein